MKNNIILFNNFKLNVAQLHDTTHQLYHTIEEFNKSNVFFDNDTDYKNHLIGKLRFFIDLYCDAHLHEHINETVVLDNYQAMLQVISNSYTQDDLNDAFSDYKEFIFKMIDDIFDSLDDNQLFEMDDVINFVNGFTNINFQEAQLIVDCYIASLANYKIITKNGENETDYTDYRETIAINNFCETYNCNVDDIIVKRLYDEQEYYTAKEFYKYMLQECDVDFDVILDFDDKILTIREWISHTIQLLTDVNRDLIKFEDFETVLDNIKTINKLIANRL